MHSRLEVRRLGLNSLAYLNRGYEVVAEVKWKKENKSSGSFLISEIFTTTQTWLTPLYFKLLGIILGIRLPLHE